MKKSITLLLFFLISINFCEDNSQREDSKKIQALSLLAVQSQNAQKQLQESNTFPIIYMQQ